LPMLATPATITAVFVFHYKARLVLEPSLDESIVTTLASSALNTVYSSIIFVIGMTFVWYWKRVSNDKLLSEVVSRVVIPYAAIFWRTSYDFGRVFVTSGVILSAVFAFIFLSFIHVHVATKFVEWYDRHPTHEKALLFGEFPPKKRSDLIGLGCLFVAVLAMPVLFSKFG